MSLETFLTSTVTILTPAWVTSARYNSERADWDHASEVDTTGWLTETSTSEDLNGRDAIVTGWRLFLPAGTEITGSDRVVVDGATFEVEGQPHSATTPAGEHHVEVSLRRVVG